MAGTTGSVAIADATAALQLLTASLGLTHDEVVNLVAGVADGGPNADGFYPVTLPGTDGAQVKVPSPLKQAQPVGTFAQARAATDRGKPIGVIAGIDRLRTSEGADYRSDPTVLPVAAGPDLIPADDFVSGAWTGTAAVAANGDWTTLSDTSATDAQFRQYLFAAPADRIVSWSIEVRKDGVPASIRSTMVQAHSVSALGTGVRTLSMFIDTSTGEFAQRSSGAITPLAATVADGGDRWLLSMTGTLLANDLYAFYILPAAGLDLGTEFNLAAQGSVDVRLPRLFAPAKNYIAENPRTSFLVKDQFGITIGHRLDDNQTITLAHFGARGAATGADDGDAIEEAYDYVSRKRELRDVNFGGAFVTGRPLTIGTTSGEWATQLIKGHLRLAATSAMDTLLTLRNPIKTDLDKFTLIGTGGQQFGTRTVMNGLRVSKNSGRAGISRLQLQNFAHAGLYTDGDTGGTGGNANYLDFGHLSANFCGSGSLTNGQIGTFTSAFTYVGNSGSVESTTQRSVLEVSAMISAQIEAQPGKKEVWIPINDYGANYQVMGIDRTVTPNRISIYPVFPRATAIGTTGTAYWTFGAGLHMQGVNSNGVMGRLVDVRASGRAIYNNSLYGFNIDELSANFCGTGIALGQGQANGTYENRIGQAYFEHSTNLTEVQFLSRFATLQINPLGSPDFARWRTSAWYRRLDDTFESVTSLPPMNIGGIYDGQPLRFHQRSSPMWTRKDPILVNFDNAVHQHPFGIADYRIALRAVDPALWQLFGYNSATVVCWGSGNNDAPTTVTVICPPGGTLNGAAANVVFNGFTDVARIELVCLDPVALAYGVRRR